MTGQSLQGDLDGGVGSKVGARGGQRAHRSSVFYLAQIKSTFKKQF